MTDLRYFEPSDPRLGRHVQHDPRSLAYAVGVLPKSAISSVEWERRAPIFDQGSLGSCVGNSAAGLLGTDGKDRKGLTEVTIDGETVKVDEDLAVRVYKRATELDQFDGQYPPTDTGSSGIGGAKALQSMGLVTSYSHAFSLEALNAALQTGPVMIGIPWYGSMFDPGAGNVLDVNHRSPLSGGHELIVSGYDLPADRYTFTNSWGAGWGDEGRAYVHALDLKWLLSQQGDVTQPVFVSQPVPEPTPEPTPEPAPEPVDVDRDLWQAVERWAAAKNLT